MRNHLRPTLLALALTAPFPAGAADIFSPGDLSRAHAGLSGLGKCTQCHPAGQQLSQARCIDCHKELQSRLASGQGLHGRLAARERDCWSCHHEHQGRDAPLVDWGEAGAKRFDHARTGTALAGKHAGVACEKCHDVRLIADPEVKALLARAPSRRTFLGAPAMGTCAGCHFDEHRGQLGPECRRCHVESGWKPASRFDHARTAYPLTGKHAAVACARCHPAVPDPGSAHGALTAPVSPRAYLRYRPVAHAGCLDCHRDVHQGRFGTSCARCHVTDDWKRIVAGEKEQRTFHDKTRYPLLGAHRTVACARCHGPFAGEPALFKRLPFAACSDCHADAHAGQLARRGREAGACDRCHDVNAFQPAKFGLDDHERTAYRLEGAHRAVACARCHPQEPRLAERLPAEARAELERRGRPVRLSLAVYHVAGNPDRCETCHADPHAGQLARPEGCAACHSLESFARVRFDHQKDSRFPLTGKHARARCAACHRPDPSAPEAAVRYRPLALACAGCHSDPHAGQFAAGGGDCARCHDTGDWKKLLFVHEKPFTDYSLTGKHRQVACARCHPLVPVAPGVEVRRYRPLPRACDGCHADFHRGAFRGFDPTGMTR